MKFICFILFLISFAQANTSLDHKKGGVIGIGASMSQYTFPVQFEGTTKKKIDDSSTLFGPALGIGYDVVMFDHILLGLRGEGFIGDTLSAGNKEKSQVTDKTTGKLRAASMALRGGFIFIFNPLNPVGQSTPMIGEIFFETGITSGHKSFSKNYSTTATVTENYHDNLEEEFQGQTMALGFNLTGQGGAFLELKGMQSSITHNKQVFRGTQLVDGGSTTPTDQNITNDNKKSFTTFLLIVGHHY
jgi:hypothetical protein